MFEIEDDGFSIEGSPAAHYDYSGSLTMFLFIYLLFDISFYVLFSSVG